MVASVEAKRISSLPVGISGACRSIDTGRDRWNNHWRSLMEGKLGFSSVKVDGRLSRVEKSRVEKNRTSLSSFGPTIKPVSSLEPRFSLCPTAWLVRFWLVPSFFFLLGSVGCGGDAGLAGWLAGFRRGPRWLLLPRVLLVISQPLHRGAVTRVNGADRDRSRNPGRAMADDHDPTREIYEQRTPLLSMKETRLGDKGLSSVLVSSWPSLSLHARATSKFGESCNSGMPEGSTFLLEG